MIADVQVCSLIFDTGIYRGGVQKRVDARNGLRRHSSRDQEEADGEKEAALHKAQFCHDVDKQDLLLFASQMQMDMKMTKKGTASAEVESQGA
jgi:hypothetical protein